MVDDSPLTKFIRWFVIPFNMVKNIPNGDGAFVALSIGLSLCERYFRVKSQTAAALTEAQRKEWNRQNNAEYDQQFQFKAAESLGVTRGDFESFWLVYRNGLQHQGMPRLVKLLHQDGSTSVEYGWEFESTDNPAPRKVKRKAKRFVIYIDPWAFTQWIIDLLLEDPHTLEQSIDHPVASLYERR